MRAARQPPVLRPTPARGGCGSLVPYETMARRLTQRRPQPLQHGLVGGEESELAVESVRVVRMAAELDGQRSRDGQLTRPLRVHPLSDEHSEGTDEASVSSSSNVLNSRPVTLKG